MNKKRLFLLDAMALIYRAYYAFIKSPRYTSKGFNTSAILGFTNTLLDVIKNESPTHIAVAFDTGAPTVRHADFEAYKAHRDATPEGIIEAIPYIKEILEAFRIPILALDGYEADDIIGTLAKNAEADGYKVFMMTSDKDYGQLVSENIFIYKPAKFGKKSEILGVKEICSQYEIKEPEQLIDILGLWGDSSDNIPGVPSIGEVRAKKLIKEFGSIESIYQQLEKVESAKLQETLKEHQEQAFLSKMLATIILDVPIAFNFEEMVYSGPDLKKLLPIFNELEFKSLSQRVTKDFQNSAQKQEKKVENDLFSTPQKEIEDIPQLFKTFKDISLTFQQIDNYNDLITNNIKDSTQLYFNWIFADEKMTGFAFSTKDSPIYYHFLENREENYKKILQFIFENSRTVVTYNCKNFYQYFKILKINSKVTFFDILIAHYVIQPEKRHQLKVLAENYLEYSMITIDKKEITTTLPKQTLTDIAGERIAVFKKLHPILADELEKTNTVTLFSNIEIPLAEVLASMEFHGITFDTNVLAENEKELSEEISKLEKEIFELAGKEFNITSPKQLGEVLFEDLQIIKNAKLTKTKQYQTGEEVLSKLVDKHPIVRLILEYRSLTKLKSTYIDALPLLVNPKTKKIHTTFNQTVTSTGRLSSVNPNLQNIPIRTQRGKEVRKAFVASDKDWVILSADYSQIELRIIASISGDENMITSFNNDEDIHAVTASHIYNIPVGQVTDEMRRQAKTVNFGIIYGISAFGLADRLRVPQRVAIDLINEYYRSFPALSSYLSKTIEFAKENGYVETLLGRRRYIREINSQNAVVRKASERNAINAPIQGSAADLIKIAMINIYRRLKEENMKTRMLLQVHDELVFEVPKEEIEKATSLIRSTMVGAISLRVPLKVDINFGKSWYDAH